MGWNWFLKPVESCERGIFRIVVRDLADMGVLIWMFNCLANTVLVVRCRGAGAVFISKTYFTSPDWNKPSCLGHFMLMEVYLYWVISYLSWIWNFRYRLNFAQCSVPFVHVGALWSSTLLPISGRDVASGLVLSSAKFLTSFLIFKIFFFIPNRSKFERSVKAMASDIR